MARPIRIEYAGALYHVTSRGDRREDIFVDDEDRLIWLEVFSQVCHRFNWRCHAWCLMDNHYHIVIETIEGNLSQGMRQLNGVFTQKSNRRHGRVGHVFQGRFKAILVQKDAYLLELSRYVVLNPIRAGMVTDLSDWKWSSYPAMIGVVSSSDWLETDWILNNFGHSRKTAINNYGNFVREGVGLSPIWAALKRQVFLGDEAFVDKALTRIEGIAGEGDLREVPRVQRRAQAKPLNWYMKNYSSRDEGIVSAYVSGDYLMKDIADEFNVHYSTVSRAIKKAEMRDCKT
jgi:putative transposase